MFVPGKHCDFKKFKINPEGVADLDPTELKDQTEKVHLVDVRRPDEFAGELGHIEGSKLVTLETDFTQFMQNLDSKLKDDTFVFICRSGARSSRAAAFANSLGFKNTFNLAGGMIYWNELKFQTTNKK